uniref:Uncharacterized protein n=1 Tax=Arundo donax TaxID=35708 RepID=A0A0A9DYU0_ARUDO
MFGESKITPVIELKPFEDSFLISCISVIATGIDIILRGDQLSILSFACMVDESESMYGSVTHIGPSPLISSNGYMILSICESKLAGCLSF